MSPSLQVLGLSRNNLTGDLPDSLGQLCNLEGFTLVAKVGRGYSFLESISNHLHGKIPDIRGYRKSNVYASGNEFEGSLPRVGDRLRELDLSSNSFSGGRIPSSMHNCKKMLKMGLADNRLGGDIPTWIGTSLVELRILILRSNNLSVNELVGLVPDHIGEMMQLQSLDLSRNSLSEGRQLQTSMLLALSEIIFWQPLTANCSGEGKEEKAYSADGVEWLDVFFLFGVFSGIFNGLQCIGVEQEVERCLFWLGRKDVEQALCLCHC
ncbi:hypothetical protein SASPL_131316 [Salvia splendens]|uniref:Uncharacterized protein n=1 Tax=Salvia splendens TaxID=180675 RepID=A0A8X8ZKR6_SALSN|nr:hypothetical protein SASPL_131316 [Salvia splendens]